ncbi:MAG: hypothetical protein SFY96_07020 [Planctomycetota bacterium]|nr:hypothetical protein [Planctomycetota bacterium]
MSPADPSKALTSLLKKLKSQHGELLHQPINAWLATKLTPAHLAAHAPAPEPVAANVDVGSVEHADGDEDTETESSTQTPAASHPPAAAPVVATPDEDPLVHELVYSFLLWDSGTTQARNLMKRLCETFVDLNELRVCLADELAEVLGERYPRAWERAQRLRATLHDLYKREHGMRLAHLAQSGKRDTRGYLDSLDGIPAFVAARMFVFGFGGHAIPCDSRLVELLADEGAIDKDMTDPAEVGSWLERQIRAADAQETALLLQAWSDEKGSAPKREKRPLDPYGLEEAVQEARAAARSAAVARASGKPAPEAKPETRAEAKSEAKAERKGGDSKNAEAKSAARATKTTKASRSAKTGKTKGR